MNNINHVLWKNGLAVFSKLIPTIGQKILVKKDIIIKEFSSKVFYYYIEATLQGFRPFIKSHLLSKKPLKFDHYLTPMPSIKEENEIKN
jgi:hypothetical protein